MSIQKIRWSRVYESSEEELTTLLKARKIKAIRLSAEAGSQHLQRVANGETTIWCAEGSMVVRTDTTTTPLQPGDALRLDTTTDYELRPGISGYVCYIS